MLQRNVELRRLYLICKDIEFQIELYLRENYLKVVRSKNVLLKKFEILNYEV